MKFITDISKVVLKAILEKPGSTAAIMVFGLGFTLVTSNALYSQQSSHPDPMWVTDKDQESLTNLAENHPAKINDTALFTRSVLTQRISLKNIPVPTAKPVRSATIASFTSLVREVQASLAEIGYYEGKVDGIYGRGTKEAIKTFQIRAGSIPNGDVDYDLIKQLQSAKAGSGNTQQQTAVLQPTQTIKPNPAPKAQSAKAGTEIVAQIQFGLKENFGIENITVDGLMGSQTKNAIRAFQERFKLNPTGELDNATLQKMKSAGILTSI